MDTSRRSFLLGAASGFTMLMLTACTDQDPPRPTPTPTGDLPVPAPVAAVRTSWGTDPFARGSSSFLAVGSSPAQREVLAEPLLNRVFFAGEATSTEFPNSVRGAIESGSRAADRIEALAEPGDRVLVIGAGIAGATAARQLADAGHQVHVIEARDRTGGRIRTAHPDDWPLPLQLGAARVPDRDDSPVLERLTLQGIRTALLEESAGALTIDGEAADLAAGVRAVTDAVQAAAEAPSDISLGGALVESGAARSDDWPVIDAYVASRIETALGGAAADLSSWYALGELPEAESSRFVLGDFQSLVDDALEGIDVSLDTPVTDISYDDEAVSLRLATGESVSADRVIVTAPLGVLKGAGIGFEPPLPFDRRAAIAEVGVGVQDSVWLLFEQPFWLGGGGADSEGDAGSEGGAGGSVLWTVVGDDVPIRTWINLEPLTGHPVLVGLVAGEAAEALAELDDDAVVEAARRSLVPFAEIG
jgi:monoamine oxidase